MAGIQYKPGKTFTHKWLIAEIELFGEMFVPRQIGRKCRRFDVVLTDGMSTERKKTVEAANRHQSIVETVVAIGLAVNFLRMNFI